MELSAGENPPGGALIDYYLKSASADAVTLEILDTGGQLVRRYSSADRPRAQNPRTSDVPAVWARTPEPLAATAGMHRFAWDLHYAAPTDGAPGGRGGGRGGGGGPWVLPGEYTVKLTAQGRSYNQPLTVKMDPRVSVSLTDLQTQLAWSREVAAVVAKNAQSRRDVEQLRAKVKPLFDQAKAQPDVLAALQSLDQKLAAIGGMTAEAPPDATGVAMANSDRSSFLHLAGAFSAVEGAAQNAEGAPTENLLTAFQKARQILAATMANWEQVQKVDVPRVNQLLRQNNLPALE